VALIDPVELLARELGAAAVIGPGDDRLETYGRDESYLGTYPLDCAVLCQSREEVALVLRLAREHRIPVTPRGAGSGMTGGALPVRGGIVLSTERMCRIVDIDEDDLVAVVEPGVITGEFQEAVEGRGLFYPPDPASLAFCSLGGNVASNAGGPRAFKYGVTREYVLGLEVALMGGELLRVGRRTSKGVTGYDLTAGFVGTEGTFAVSTEITLKLLPKPAAVQTMLAVFSDMTAAGRAVSAILRQGFRPRTVEIADKTSIDHVREKSRFPFPPGAGAIALIELDGEPEGLEAATLRAAQLCDQQAALDVVIAQDVRERRNLWEARRLISPSLRDAWRRKVNEDICVPRGAIPRMLERIDEIGARFDFPIATFGHAGDGNLHVNLLVATDPEEEQTARRIEDALDALFRATLELRGTLSGEHGIGLAKQKYIELEQTPAAIEWQRRLKRLWDPEELLNPGKIFPVRPRERCSE
jgi:glycolate oxidase